MYLRLIRKAPDYFGNLTKTEIVYVNLAKIVRMKIKNNTLDVIENGGLSIRYMFKNQSDAERVAEHIIHFQNYPQDFVDDNTQPINHFKDEDIHLDIIKGVSSRYRRKEQRMDKLSPDANALAILQEQEKSLVIIKDQQLK